MTIVTASAKDWIINTQKYIGKPWAASKFECYDFVRTMYADVLDVALPMPFEMSSKLKSQQFALMQSTFPHAWEKIDEDNDRPVVGSLITMRSTIDAPPMHCGVYVGQGFTAHVFDSSQGVLLSRRACLERIGWLIGDIFAFTGNLSES